MTERRSFTELLASAQASALLRRRYCVLCGRRWLETPLSWRGKPCPFCGGRA